MGKNFFDGVLVADYLKQEFHPEVMANILFHNWLRFSVFFWVAESDWQKMDFYFPNIMEAVRDYLIHLVNQKDFVS